MTEVHQPCVFCEIVAGREPASVIFEDQSVLAMMVLHPTSPGECIVIPKSHIDHFTDVDHNTAREIIVVAQKIGRRMREVFKPQRVGMVVHGFGVPHAHLCVVPLHKPDDITSGRYAHIKNGKIVFDMSNIPEASRATLDEHARLLKSN
jgi:histidine triad (HIT) family protein